MGSSGVVIGAGGDISLAGMVTQGLQRFGAGWVFERLTHALKAADLFTANLESPLLPNGVEPAARRHVTPGELLNASFNARLPPMAFTLANNHTLDAGRAGVIRTQRKLAEIGITHFGAGRDDMAAREPRFVDVKGLRIGFLGRTEDSPQVHGRGFPGPGLMRYPQLLRDVRGAAGRCDALIVHLHQGLEFVDWPGPHMVRLCRELVAAGARVVIGNHPHVPQGWELASRRPRPVVAGGSAPRQQPALGEARRAAGTHRGIIIYSLGNLVFDVAHNLYLRRGSPWTDRSVLAMIPVSRSGVGKPRFIPYRIERTGRPIPLDGEPADTIRRHLSMVSTDLGDAAAMREHWRQTSFRNLAIYLRWAAVGLCGSGATVEMARAFFGALAHDENRQWIREIFGRSKWIRKLNAPPWT